MLLTSSLGVVLSQQNVGSNDVFCLQFSLLKIPLKDLRT